MLFSHRNGFLERRERSQSRACQLSCLGSYISSVRLLAHAYLTYSVVSSIVVQYLQGRISTTDSQADIERV